MEPALGGDGIGDDIATDPAIRARRWIKFYDDLINYEESVLVTMRELSATLPEGEKEAVKRTDLEPLQELVADFIRRRDLWARQLEAGRGD